MTENVVTEQPWRFKPGKSGNPKGKPPGTRNKITEKIEALMEGQAEAVTQKAIDCALAGDVVALRLVLDRVAPPRRGRRFALDLGPVDGAHGLANAMSAVIAAMGRAELSAEEAQSVAAVIDAAGNAYERRELEGRIAALEGNTRAGFFAHAYQNSRPSRPTKTLTKCFGLTRL
jgi:hypothetical protein